jgi:hypothetical protein
MSEEGSSHASFLICCLVKQYVLDAKKIPTCIFLKNALNEVGKFLHTSGR